MVSIPEDGITGKDDSGQNPPFLIFNHNLYFSCKMAS